MGRRYGNSLWGNFPVTGIRLHSSNIMQCKNYICDCTLNFVKQLLTSGFSIMNEGHTDCTGLNYGCTPLHRAANEGHTDCTGEVVEIMDVLLFTGLHTKDISDATDTSFDTEG